jgi:hypothetical protein
MKIVPGAVEDMRRARRRSCALTSAPTAPRNSEDPDVVLGRARAALILQAEVLEAVPGPASEADAAAVVAAVEFTRPLDPA